MTVEIEAGSDWCFFMPDLYEYQNMDFEFQVSYQTYLQDQPEKSLDLITIVFFPCVGLVYFVC